MSIAICGILAAKVNGRHLRYMCILCICDTVPKVAFIVEQFVTRTRLLTLLSFKRAYEEVLMVHFIHSAIADLLILRISACQTFCSETLELLHVSCLWHVIMAAVYYTVNHKKRDILFWTITLANFGRFLYFYTISIVNKFYMRL